MKVLLLADIPGWIVDRCCERMIAGMPDVRFEYGYYACMGPAQLVNAAKGCDIIHYGNWDIERHWPHILDAGVPVLMSVRSHRFPPYVREVAKRVKVHVVSAGLLDDFPGAAYIPDGLMIDPRPLRVGFAGKPGEYKGTHLIEQACREIGAEFVVAEHVKSAHMEDWYRDIDVYCCASQAEGFSTPVMEALALNKPVVSVRAGVPWFDSLPCVTWVERTVAGIKGGLVEHWPSRHMQRYRWRSVCNQFRELYKSIA